MGINSLTFFYFITKKMVKNNGKNGKQAIIKAYLLFYNLTVWIGWCSVLIKTFKHLFVDNNAGDVMNTIFSEEENFDLWQKIGASLKIAQTAAILEIVHGMVGFVKAPIMSTFPQVYSRVFVLWASIHSAQPLSVSRPMFTGLVLAWSITECVRYLFYSLALYDQSAYILTYLRYTMFYVLYPFGVACEMSCMIKSAEHSANTGMYNLQLPNRWNFVFNFQYFIYVQSIVWVFGLYGLYTYMIRQRKKVLSGQASKKTK